MRSITDPVPEGRDPTAPPPTDARGPEGTMDAPPETEAACDAIER
jgi:hypothetical protein